MPLRVLLSAACLAAAVAFALTLADERRCEDARGTVFAAMFGDREAARGEAAAIATARETCRGTTALLAVAGALHGRGRDAQALPLARDAVEAEPDNPAGWRALAAVASGDEAREAESRLSRLDPLSLKRSAGRSTR